MWLQCEPTEPHHCPNQLCENQMLTQYPGPSDVDKISLHLCPMLDANPNGLCIVPTPRLYRILDSFSTISSDPHLLILF